MQTEIIASKKHGNCFTAGRQENDNVDFRISALEDKGVSYEHTCNIHTHTLDQNYKLSLKTSIT